VVLVDAAEGDLGLSVLVADIAEIESEDWLVKEILRNSRVEWWPDAVDADGVVAETHDTVEASESKGKTWLICNLGEQLVLDLQVANLDCVLRDVSLNGARSISDGKFGAILLVAGRIAVVVLLVEIAGDRAALGGWDPKVGATSVKDNLEFLGWVADGDFGEVYSILGDCAWRQVV